MSALETSIRDALAVRKAEAAKCPARKQSLGDKPCPECGATTAGPCWQAVRADSIFIDMVKKLIGDAA